MLVRLSLIPGLSRAPSELCSCGTHVLKLPENSAVRPGAIDQVLFSLIGIVFVQGVSHVHFFISLGAWSCGPGMAFSSYSWLSPEAVMQYKFLADNSI